jgi:hypothetical protein
VTRPANKPTTPRVRPLVVADLAVKLLTVVLLLWAVLNPDLPQFQGKAFTGRAIVYPAMLLLIPLGWWVFGSRTIAFPFAADLLFGLPFLIDVAGNALNLYDTVEWWDDANHLVNWALQTAAVGLLLRYGDWSTVTRAALVFGYAVTAAVLWEFAEYVTFIPDSPEAASAYADTLLDIALGMLGGLVAAVVTSRMRPVRPDPGRQLRH